MATPSSFGAGGVEVRPNWFTRNWKWAVPFGVLAMLLLAVAFVGGILFLVESSFQHSEFYAQALQRARANQQVAQKIGKPLQAGWLASGKLNASGSSGDADISIPVSGPRGKGTLYVVAKKSAGVWTLVTLQVEVTGEAGRIDLLQPDENGPGGT
jgi:cytochrome oxidase complex assembly protein 1